MATIFAASESTVSIGGQLIEGVVSLDYRFQQVRQDIHALGATERIGVISGPKTVEGRLAVASTSPLINALPAGDEPFQIIINLKHGEALLQVTFDECHLTNKSFSLTTGGHGETVYGFTAARVREGA